MHEYDVALKLLLRSLTSVATRVLTGVSIVRWHNVELPEISDTRMDMLGETPDGWFAQVELQSTNDSNMPLRMLEYSVRVYRKYGSFPRQIVLYVGEAPLRMSATLSGGGLDFPYELIDIRELDGEALLDSPEIGDNILAVLTKLRDQSAAVREILRKIGGLGVAEREIAFKQLMILAGLRRLEQFVTEEARKMPILLDIMDHQVIGPAIRQGREQGLVEGREEGIEVGLHRGLRREALSILRRLTEKRFGPLPETVSARLAEFSTPELEALALRLFDVESVDELLR